jgi:hypothetical protein
MTQLPAVNAFVHAPVVVLQPSVVQLSPSLQLAQVAPVAPHTVEVSDASAVQVPDPSVLQPVVQHEPDSQRPPVHDVPFDLLLHAVVLVAVLQLWQAFDGLTAPLA